MSDPTQRVLLTVEEYLDELFTTLLAGTAALDATEEVALAQALGRVLARPVHAAGDVPAFANSAMDGYAVLHEDLTSPPVTLRVVGAVPAGSSEDPPVHAGECVRIMTGAPLPSDTDTVVPVEVTDGGTSTVTIAEARSLGQHVRDAGEDVREGAVVAEAGVTITGRVLGSLAAAGAATVTVRRRPVVAVAATGDELVAPGGSLVRGQIFESNGTHLAATLSELGVQVRGPVVLPDNTEGFTSGLDELADGADLVLLTGGVSVGDFDVSRIVLEESAAGVFRHLRMQPGKPQGWARWHGVPVIAFPGNPVSTAISFEVFGRPVIDRMLGREPTAGPTRAVAGTGWRSPAGRRQLVPVRLSSDETGRLVATPTHRRGSASHMVTSLAGAHALAIVAEEIDSVEPGDIVQIRSL
ncbi:molybdenum cofactor biosynthesis protein [Janibacter sp. Soil728]|uniref:molybdopterin molybdotransferase MoeA n=1 Tax=Janibacter sp. Soil728 TaxID=1736393 RepID=UPI0006F41090|nr:gephyrin-like molybdotransferase Glp [Janibacter sp. Soil728]KRE37795.1 molybdenum cofactor biosynthesis protein [Janibacter sp. Soil728]